MGDTDVPTNQAADKWLDARYVGETIADLTMVRPAQPFVQTWTMENRGTQRWPEGCALVRIGGEVMGSPSAVPLPPADPGEQVSVSAPFVAPLLAGSYTSTWQPADAEGTRFGDPVWVTVFVAERMIYLPNVQTGLRPVQAPAPAFEAGVEGTVATSLPVQMVRAYAKLGLDVNAPIDPASGLVAPQVADPRIAADTGVGWVRINLILGQQWGHPLDDKRPQGMTWAETYRFILDSFRSRGLRIYALVGHEAVAEDPGDRFRDAPGADPLADPWVQQYAGNVLAIAQLFRDQIEVIETFNEPDDWHGRDRNWIHPGWLAAMLEAVYRAVRSDTGLAHLRIVSGPLQGLQGEGKSNGAADYLDRVYQAGIGMFGWGRDGRPFPFDGVGYHLYVHENATDNMDQQALDLDNTYRAYLAQMLDVIRRQEGVDKPLYVSEAGWFSNGGNREFCERFQAVSLQLGINRLLAEPAVALVFAFCLQDFGGPDDGKFYGLYRAGDLDVQNRKPAYDALRAVATSPNLVPTSERPPIYDSARYIAGKDAVADETPFAPGASVPAGLVPGQRWDDDLGIGLFARLRRRRPHGRAGAGGAAALCAGAGDGRGGRARSAAPRLGVTPASGSRRMRRASSSASVCGRSSTWCRCRRGQRCRGTANGCRWLPVHRARRIPAPTPGTAGAGASTVRTTRSLQDSLRWLVRLGVIYEGALEKLPASGDAEAVALAVDAAVAEARRQLEELLSEP